MVKRKQKRWSLANRPKPSGARYAPGTFPIDDQHVMETLLGIPADRLPTSGLAMWYLHSAPLRSANQCLMASSTISVIQALWGIPSHLVALELEVPSSDRTSVVRYGSPTPSLTGDRLVGHIGLVGQGWFMDPTASQFPEIRQHGGIRPLGGLMNAPLDGLLERGAMAQVRLLDGLEVIYRIHPAHVLNQVLMQVYGTDETRAGYANLANNTALTYLAGLAHLVDEGHLDLNLIPHARFAAAVRSMLGMSLEERDGRLVPVPAT